MQARLRCLTCPFIIANSTRSLVTSARGGARSTRHRPAPLTTASGSPSAVPEGERGVFQNIHLRPHILRAAIDLGSGGVASLCVARVDVKARAIEKVLYHVQLPLNLEAFLEAEPTAGQFALSEQTAHHITSTMEIISGVLKRFGSEGGVDERAAVLTWPLCAASNSQTIARDLTQRFKVNVKVLGVDWHVTSGLQLLSADEERPTTSSVEAPHSRQAEAEDDAPDLKDLLWMKLDNKQQASNSPPPPPAPPCHPAAVRAQVELLAFLSHAAVSQCVAPHRLLVVDEDPQRGIQLIGTNTSPEQEVRSLIGSEEAEEEEEEVKGRMSLLASHNLLSPQASSPSPLLRHSLSVSVADTLRLCVTAVQRRSVEHFHVHRSSPNPLLRSEFRALRQLLVGQLAPSLPPWVVRKALLGGVIAGTSFNGGFLNIAARVAQRSPIPLDHLETHAEYHFCGLTDVLLANNFPHPYTVLPSAALCAALCRALHTPRIHYSAEVSTAVGLVVQPGLWTGEQREAVERDLGGEAFYRSARHRTFHRPHMKDNPTAPPSAFWQEAGLRESKETSWRTVRR